MARCKTINIKENLPTVEEARKLLIKEIDKAINENYTYIKIIHGYGSNGVGGSIGKAVQKSLKYRRKEGKVLDYISGDRFETFNPYCQKILDKYSYLHNDKDYNNKNFGITIAILNI